MDVAQYLTNVVTASSKEKDTKISAYYNQIISKYNIPVAVYHNQIISNTTCQYRNMYT